MFGTYPLDPNLIGQGIPPDDRMNWNRDRIFGPVNGTPLPPGVGGPPVGAPLPPGPPSPAAQMGEVSPIAPIDAPNVPNGSPPAAPGNPPAGLAGGAPAVAPSAFGRGMPQPGPSVAITQYDPHTGSYVGPDGQVYRQSDLVAHTTPKTWKDMFTT